WDQSQARTWNAICRHTALTALAQLRTAALQAALASADVLPAAPAASQDTPGTPDETTVNPADLQIYIGTAPLPARGGQPCPPGIPPIRLSAAETSRLAFHLRWSAWRRRHQSRARWHHYSTRLAALTT